MLYLNSFSDKIGATLAGFNFNKCCIWIMGSIQEAMGNVNLTLTSVVFEFLNR